MTELYEFSKCNWIVLLYFLYIFNKKKISSKLLTTIILCGEVSLEFHCNLSSGRFLKYLLNTIKMHSATLFVKLNKIASLLLILIFYSDTPSLELGSDRGYIPRRGSFSSQL